MSLYILICPNVPQKENLKKCKNIKIPFKPNSVRTELVSILICKL